MRVHKILVVSFFFVLFNVILSLHVNAETANLGLIDGIWFSEKDYVVGDQIVLHTAIFNNSDYLVRGTVEFYDNADLLGTRSFEVPHQTIKQLSLSTTASEGEHVFSAKISESTTTSENGTVTNLLPIVVDSNSLKIVEPAPTPIKIEDDKENDSSEKTDNLLQDIIDTLEKYQGNPVVLPSDVNNTGDTEVLGTSSEEQVTTYPNLVAIPSGVKSINEKFPLVSPLTLGLNKFQNSSVGLFENLRSKNLQSLGKLEPESTQATNLEASENSESLPNKEISKFEKVMRLLWGALLNFLVLIFSCLWCVVLLTLLVIYGITKYLFKIGGKSAA